MDVVWWVEDWLIGLKWQTFNSEPCENAKYRHLCFKMNWMIAVYSSSVVCDLHNKTQMLLFCKYLFKKTRYLAYDITNVELPVFFGRILVILLQTVLDFIKKENNICGIEFLVFLNLLFLWDWFVLRQLTVTADKKCKGKDNRGLKLIIV